MGVTFQIRGWANGPPHYADAVSARLSTWCPRCVNLTWGHNGPHASQVFALVLFGGITGNAYTVLVTMQGGQVSLWSLDEVQVEWVARHEVLAKFVALVSAFLFASYVIVDAILAPQLLGQTWPWRVGAMVPCVGVYVLLTRKAWLRWVPLATALTALVITCVVSVIFVVILGNVPVGIAAQMQVLMAVAVIASLRTVVRVLVPALLLSFNAALWWTQASAQSFALANWVLVCALGVLVIVSEAAYRNFLHRRRLELTLLEQANIVQTSDDAIITQLLDGTVSSWNKGAERLFGYTAEEMLGRSMQALFPSELATEEALILQRIAAGESVQHFETVRVCKGGRLKDVSVSISPLRDAQGRLVGASKIARDISERKRIEATLYEKEQIFRLAIETSGEGFWVANAAGRILDVNEAYATYSGYSRDELLTKTINELDALESPQETAAHLLQLQQQGNGIFETQHRRKDGTVWPVEIAVSYSPLSGGLFFVFSKDLTERKKVEELTWRQANFDHLTGLANRALFFDRVATWCAQAKRHQRKVVVFFADLDGFKVINDTHGHDAGDRVLQAVATRWLTVVRETDTVARLGGDEFAVVLGDVESPEVIASMAEKLILALKPPITFGQGGSGQVGVSIGVSVYPDDGLEATALISAADAAMYASKKRGKNTYTLSGTGQGATL